MAHLALMGFILAWTQLSGILFKKPSQTVWIEVDPLPKKDSARNRIVQTQVGEKTKEAPKDAFLGKQNQRVDRQTVSKTQLTQTAQVAKPQPQANPLEKASTPEKTSSGKGALSHLGLAILPKVKVGQDTTQQERPNPPQWQKYEGTVAQDYVKGILESDTTALNTKEYVFWGYFQRIRERLDIAWNRRLRTQLSKLWKKGRGLAAQSDHTTRLLVTLDPQGKIVRVQVLEDSGTVDLDQAAIRAFNDAGPFPNPPNGIVDQQGRIQIRWDFVLKT